MSITSLIVIVAPPTHPIETGAEAAWRAVESKLKVSYPRDLHDLMVAYGSGMFTNSSGGDVVYFYNPFAAHYVEFLKGEHGDLREYRREEGKDEFEYPVFPRSPGVFLLGRASMEYDIFYLTHGEPDQWPVMVRSVGDSTFERYQMPLSQFLAELFGGKKRMAPWPAKWFAKRRITFEPGHLSAPDEAVVEYKSILDLYRDAGKKTPFWIRGGTDENTRATVVKGVVVDEAKNVLSVIVDIYEDGQRVFKDYEMGERSRKPIFRLIPTPGITMAE